jgi:DNA-binding transcriptional LysR family regulator
MNDRDWSILATIARERNISRAAERLFISQPALSVRLRAIESEFNARIFLRTPKGVSLTPEGEQLVAYANDMLPVSRAAVGPPASGAATPRWSCRSGPAGAVRCSSCSSERRSP